MVGSRIFLISRDAVTTVLTDRLNPRGEDVLTSRGLVGRLNETFHTHGTVHDETSTSKFLVTHTRVTQEKDR